MYNMATVGFRMRTRIPSQRQEQSGCRADFKCILRSPLRRLRVNADAAIREIPRPARLFRASLFVANLFVSHSRRISPALSAIF